MIKKEPKADLYSHKISLYFFHYKTTIVIQKSISLSCISLHQSHAFGFIHQQFHQGFTLVFNLIIKHSVFKCLL